MRALVLVLVLLVACSAAIPPAREAEPSPPAARDVWAFSGTLLRPGAPSLYENVLDAVVPLRDRGWLVLKETAPRRFLPCLYCLGGPLLRRPLATLIRLDADGVEVAREHGAEPFGLAELRVFEDLGLVIGMGPQVRNGSIHAFDLATLDGRWSDLGSNCVAVADRCWTWRPYTNSGTTALTERDARTYRAITTYEHLRMDGLQAPPGIYPELNTVIWQAPPAPGVRGLPRVAALDPSRPVIPWRRQVEEACSVHTVGTTHLFLWYPDSCDDRDPGAVVELVEVMTGRTVKRWPANESVFLDPVWLRDELGRVIDPDTGSASIDLPGKVMALDRTRGVASVSLSNGGVAVYERQRSMLRRSSVPFTEEAKVACASLEFPLFAPARDGDGRCPPLDAAAGPGRFLVTLGRVRAPPDLAVTGITADPATRELLVHLEARGELKSVVDLGAGRVIELSDPPHGQWLVRLERSGVAYITDTFVIDLP